MKRIHPSRIRDTVHLSRLLDQLMQALQSSPLQLQPKALCYDAHIPELVFRRLQDHHRQPEQPPGIQAEDFHILFANILFRFPTVRLYQRPDGRIFFKM